MSSMIQEECSSRNWMNKVKHQLKNLTETRSIESERWKHEAIFMIPPTLRNLSTTAYQPQTVSIGPYHHGEELLVGMEKHKQRALHNFLERHRPPLECYVNALEQVVEDLYNAYVYHELKPKWKDKEAFLELMMVDGCFILELMLTEKAEDRKMTRYAENDPVFSSRGHVYLAPYLRRDMLMLENQLPMQVLTTILALAYDLNLDAAVSKLNAVILKFFPPPRQTSKKEKWPLNILGFFSLSQQSSNMREFGKRLHILDLYRESLLLDSSNKSKTQTDEEASNSYARSATELREAGIRIRQSKTRSLDDVSFQGGVLKLPLIEVDDSLESEYLNIMALERLRVGTSSKVTSFVFFMDKIIDCAKDVSLLHRRGILQHALSSDEDVARLFNSLSKEACLESDNELSHVHQQVDKYCRSTLHRWMADVKHNYFTNPWVGLSVVAAIFLFALTGIQTVYTVLGYYKDPS